MVSHELVPLFNQVVGLIALLGVFFVATLLLKAFSSASGRKTSPVLLDVGGAMREVEVIEVRGEHSKVQIAMGFPECLTASPIPRWVRSDRLVRPMGREEREAREELGVDAGGDR